MSPNSVAPESSPAIVPESPLVSNARLRQIYTFMLHCHIAQARISSLVAQGRIAAELLSAAGGEATLASAAVELRPDDTLCCARHDWLPAILKGLPLEKVVRWLLASVGSRPRALSDNSHQLLALPLRPEAQFASVVEAAAAHKRRKGSLIQAYIGNEPAADAWQAPLRLAARRRLPLVFICRTNLTQPGLNDFEALAQTAQTPYIHVDGGDALAVYRVAQEATGRARRGLGPTLIECRLQTTGKSGGASDPFAAMERHLTAKGIFSADWKHEIEAAFTQQLEGALNSAEQRTAARTAASTSQ